MTTPTTAANQPTIGASQSNRIMVCIGPSPTSLALIHAASSLAKSLDASWIAAHVRVDLDAEGEARALEHLRFAREEGAEVLDIVAEDVASTLIKIAQDRAVRLIVLGKPRRSVRRWNTTTIADQIIDGSTGIEIHLVGDNSPHELRNPGDGPRRDARIDYRVFALWALVMVLLALISLAVPPSISLLSAAALGMILARRMPLVWAVICGVSLGLVPGVANALAIAPAARPILQLMMSPILIGTICFLAARLQARIPRHEAAALERERHLSALHGFARDLVGTRAEGDVLEATKTRLEEVLETECRVLGAMQLSDEERDDVEAGGESSLLPRSIRPVSESDRAALEHLRRTGVDAWTVGEWYWVPIRSSSHVHGAVAVRNHPRAVASDPKLALMIVAMANHAALALERIRLAKISAKQALDAKSERMRTTLLNSVSHDLRTPLGAILASASWMLREPAMNQSTRVELLESIEGEAVRLDRAMQNLLGLTRVEEEPHARRGDWNLPEDIISSALERLARSSDVERVEVSEDPASQGVLVRVDDFLVELAILNIVDNALRYGGEDVSVRITSRVDESEGDWVLSVEDSGPGVPPEECSYLFDKFWRGSAASTVRGSGLGLAICSAVANCHGGAIRYISDAPETTFELRLPTETQVVSLPEES